MLTTKEIVKNTEKYFKTATTFGVMNEELTNFLGENFIKAPASTHTNLNNAFEGGLILHLLTVTKYAVIINDALPEEDRVTKESLIRVCLLHQIGKAHQYVPCTSDWHIKQGRMYDFNNTLPSMRIGERSLYYLMANGIKLTEDEYVAIAMFDKTDDKMAEYHNNMLGEILKAASVFAIKNEKKAVTE